MGNQVKASVEAVYLWNSVPVARFFLQCALAGGLGMSPGIILGLEVRHDLVSN